MFKQLQLFAVPSGFTFSPSKVEKALGGAVFHSMPVAECHGWVSPRDTPHAALLEYIGGQALMAMQFEVRKVPKDVIDRKVKELVDRSIQTTGSAPGKKQIKELREATEQALIPNVLPRQSRAQVWFDPKASILAVDVTSPASDTITTELVRALDGFSASEITTAISPSDAMAQWLRDGAPSGFTVDRECSLKSPMDKAAVTYKEHNLDLDEVRHHLTDGKQPKTLAMTWQGRVSFVLTDALCIKRIKLLEGVGGKDDADFDASFTITTGEIQRLIADLIEALGGVA